MAKGHERHLIEYKWPIDESKWHSILLINEEMQVKSETSYVYQFGKG